MNNNRRIFFLLLIIIIAIFLRFYQIREIPPGLYPDEAMNGNNALEAIRTGSYKVFYPENNGREGLFINIQAKFLKILLPLNQNQPEPWMLRLPSAIFGTLTVLGVYFLTSSLFSKNVGLTSSFFLATSFWHINFSRIGFRAIMAPFFLVWGLYFLLLSLRNAGKNLKIILLAALGGIIYGLGGYSYIAYRATPLLILTILLFCWLKNKEKENRKKILISAFFFILSAIIVTAPLGLYFFKNPQDFFGRTTQVSIFSSLTPLKDLIINTAKTVGMFNFAGDWNWRHNYAGRPQLFWPVGIFFIIGIVIGIKQILKINDLGFWILFFWMFLAALPVVISNEGLPHALRAILMIPPVFILAALGAHWTYEKTAEKLNNKKMLFAFPPSVILTAASYLLFAALIFEAYYTYFISWGKNENVQGAFSSDYVDLGRMLLLLPQGTPKFVVVKAQGVNVRGIPMPAQTTMFITDTFSPEKQKEKNIYYLTPEKENNEIYSDSFIFYLK